MVFLVESGSTLKIHLADATVLVPYLIQIKILSLYPGILDMRLLFKRRMKIYDPILQTNTDYSIFRPMRRVLSIAFKIRRAESLFWGFVEILLS